jgi:uncharacterized protein YpmB
MLNFSLLLERFCPRQCRRWAARLETNAAIGQSKTFCLVFTENLEIIMKRNRILVGSLVIVVLILSVVVFAQVKRPYHNGTVWDVEFIRMKPGMETAYLTYIADEWKREREIMKKDRQILSYKVLQTENHDPTDFNLMLMTEYKDLATMEASQNKADEVYQKVTGDEEKQRQGYRERLEIREIMGSRSAREIVLEPKR